MATELGNSFHAFLLFLKRRTISYREAAHQKYCCFRRSSFPRSRLEIVSLGSTLRRLYVLVIGVKHSRNGLGALLVRYGAFILARVELLEVEFAASSLATPETKVVACASLVSGYYQN
jgi:hypothetical protein